MKKIFLWMLLSVGMSSAAMAAEYQVDMKFDEDSGDVYFEPKTLKIKSGDVVVFKHADSYNIHNIMFEPQAIPEGANIPMMSPEEMEEGDTWKVTFDKSGTYKYHCHPHYDMGMMGEIIVDYPSKVNTEKGSHSHSGGKHH